MPDDVSQQTAGGAPQGQAPAVGVTLTTPAAAAGAGAGAGSSGSLAADAGAGSKVWYEGLVKDEGNLGTMKAKNWATLDDAVKSYRELETKISQGQQAKRGPAAPTDYKFEVPDTMKDHYSKEFADGFRNWAHKLDLSQEQAKGLHDSVLEFSQQAMKVQSAAASKALETSILTTKTDLESAWGNEKSPEFARNLEMSRRAIEKLDPGLKDALKASGVITENGTVTNSAIMKAMAKVGAAMFAEDTVHGQQAITSNPFEKGKENPLLQSRLFQTDPEKAKLLIRAAGVDKEWAHAL